MPNNTQLQPNLQCPSLYNYGTSLIFNTNFDALEGIKVEFHSDTDLSNVLMHVKDRINKLITDFGVFMKSKSYNFKVDRRSLHLTLYYIGAIGGAFYRYDGPNNQFEGYADLRFDLIAPPIGTNPDHDQFRHEIAHILHTFLVKGFSNYQPITEGFGEFVQYYLDNNNPCVKTDFLWNYQNFDIGRIFATTRTTQFDMYNAGYWFNLYMHLKGDPLEYLELLTPQQNQLTFNWYYNIWEDTAIKKAFSYKNKHQAPFLEFLKDMRNFCSNPNHGQIPTNIIPISKELVLEPEIENLFIQIPQLQNLLDDFNKKKIQLFFKANNNNNKETCLLTNKGFDCKSNFNPQKNEKLKKNFLGSILEMFIYGDNCHKVPEGQLDVGCPDVINKCYTRNENKFLDIIQGSDWNKMLNLVQLGDFESNQIESWKQDFEKFSNSKLRLWSQNYRKTIQDWNSNQCSAYRKELQNKYLSERSITTEVIPVTNSSISNINPKINLFKALQNGNLGYIRGAFDFGNIDVNSLSIDKKTPLLLIAVNKKCNFRVLQYLLSKGAYKILDTYPADNTKTTRQLILLKCENDHDYVKIKKLLVSYPEVPNPIQDFCIDNNLLIKEDFSPYLGIRGVTFSLLERLLIEFFTGLLNGTMPFAVSKIKSKLIVRYPVYKQTINRIGNFLVLPLASTSINLIHTLFTGPATFLSNYNPYEEEKSIIPSLGFYFGSSLLSATAIQGIRSIIIHFIGEGKITQAFNFIFFLSNMAMLLTSKDFEENPIQASAGYIMNFLASITMATFLQYLENRRAQKKIVIDNREEIIELNSANRNTENLSSSKSSFDSDNEISVQPIYQNISETTTSPGLFFSKDRNNNNSELQEKLALQRIKNGM
jgi:hypothetical protein